MEPKIGDKVMYGDVGLNGVITEIDGENMATIELDEPITKAIVPLSDLKMIKHGDK